MALQAVCLMSGVGGLDAALEYHGVQVVAQVENDPFCNAVLALRWPGVPRYGDIKEIDWHAFTRRHGRPDLVAAGFPCQPTSQAGRRKAQEDPRWLWPEVARCLRVLRPRYVFLENTLGLLSWGAHNVLGDLATLLYDAVGDCFQAADVGAPHERDRVFVLAYPQQPGLQGPEAAGAYSNGDAWRPPVTGRGRGLGDSTGPGRRPSSGEPGSLGGSGPAWRLQPDRPGGSRDPGPGSLEPGVGRGADGPAGWMDGHRWPAPPGPDQYSWEPPRTVGRGEVPNRAFRVKALGNLVVPQQGALAFGVLWGRMLEELAAADAEA